MHESSLFSTFSLAFVISYIFDNRHSDRCVVISPCGFDLHLSDSWCLAFHVPVRHVYVFCGKNDYSGPLPICWSGYFVCLLLSYTNSLYILDINLLLDRQFANILSISISCLFILLMVSLGGSLKGSGATCIVQILCSSGRIRQLRFPSQLYDAEPKMGWWRQCLTMFLTRSHVGIFSVAPCVGVTQIISLRGNCAVYSCTFVVSEEEGNSDASYVSSLDFISAINRFS